MKRKKSLSICSAKLLLILFILPFMGTSTFVFAEDKNPDTCKRIGLVSSDGKGGGTSMKIAFSDLLRYRRAVPVGINGECAAVLNFKVKSGTINSVTAITRKLSGEQQTILHGPMQSFMVDSLIERTKKEKTDLIVSVNGSPRRFEAVKGRAEILICRDCGGMGRVVRPQDWCEELKKRPDYKQITSGDIDMRLVHVKLDMTLSPLDDKNLQSDERLTVTNRHEKTALMIYGIYFSHWYRGEIRANRHVFADVPNNVIYTYCVPPGQSALIFKQKSRYAKENVENKTVIHLDTNAGELKSNPVSYVSGPWVGGIGKESW